MKRYLFIGGPYNGAWNHVRSSSNHVLLANSATNPYSNVSYSRWKIGGHEFFAWDNLSTYQVKELLGNHALSGTIRPRNDYE